jgi:hypothetical protein
VGEHEIDLVFHGHEGAAKVDGHQAVPLVVGDLVDRLDAAVARPMPLVAPVTNATFPSTRPVTASP